MESTNMKKTREETMKEFGIANPEEFAKQIHGRYKQVFEAGFEIFRDELQTYQKNSPNLTEIRQIETLTLGVCSYRAHIVTQLCMLMSTLEFDDTAALDFLTQLKNAVLDMHCRRDIDTGTEVTNGQS